jgi:hypothetical protein
MFTKRSVVIVVLVQILLALAIPVSAQESRATTADCSLRATGAVPLPDLGIETYMGEQGGLYPDGSNQVPTDHQTLGLWHASQIEPMDGNGVPDPSGKIVVLSIGVSNTKTEFEALIRNGEELADSDVVMVNGAQSGRDVARWQDLEADTWQRLDKKLNVKDVTPEQVQVVWIKLPDSVDNRADIVPFPGNAATYRDQLAVVVQNAVDKFPNLRIAYLSTRIYAGYNTTGRPSPEPLAYENGFGAKWLIADQIAGDASLNADPRRGVVEVPWLAWGPYLWADGTTPRGDGLIWECEDLEEDGVHPSESGAVKVAEMLVAHFSTDPTAAPWFLPDGVAIGEVTLSPLGDPPVTTTEPPVTITTTTTAPPATTVTTQTENAERPGRSDRAAREEERAQRQLENSEPGSNEGLLIMTAVGLAVLLGGVAGVGWVRRRSLSGSEDVS